MWKKCNQYNKIFCEKNGKLCFVGRRTKDAQNDNDTYGTFTTLLPIINRKQSALWSGLAGYQVGTNMPVAASILYRIQWLSASPRGVRRYSCTS
jgi:hypothetical protein